MTVVAVQPAIETDRATIDSSRSGDEIAKLALNFRATNNTSPIVVATLAQGVQQDRGGSHLGRGQLAVHDVVLGRRHLDAARPLRRTVARAVSVGRIDRGVQGQLGEQQPRVHAGERHHDDDQEREQPAARHGVLVLPGQHAERASTSSRRATRPASRSSRRSARTLRRLGGGPIVRNRTFFFGTFEGVRRPNEVTLSQVVPPDAWRTGNLSSVADADPQPVHRRQPIANNQIPVNPVSARALDLLYERQNQPTGAAISARTSSSTRRATSPSMALTAASIQRFRRRSGCSAASPSRTSRTRRHRRLEHQAGRSVQADRGSAVRRHLTTGRSASLLNELRGGFSSTRENTATPTPARAPTTSRRLASIGLPGPPVDRRVPGISSSPTDRSSRPAARSRSTSSSASIRSSDTLSWVTGRHTLKAGVDIQHVEYEDQISFFDGEELGRYEFDGSFTGQRLRRLPARRAALHRLHPARAGRESLRHLLRVLRSGRLAADADADDQLRPALRPAPADARSQQPARQLRSRLPGRPRHRVRRGGAGAGAGLRA